MASGSSTPRDKGPEIERWVSVLLRSLHLAGVVWLGAFVLAAQPPAHAAGLLTLITGLVMLVMDLRAGRIALGEVAGAFVLLKLGLVGWMAAAPSQAVWIFWALLIGSSVASHAPKPFRHWPTKKASSPAPRGTPRSRA